MNYLEAGRKINAKTPLRAQMTFAVTDLTKYFKETQEWPFCTTSHGCVSFKELISTGLIVLGTWERKKDKKFCVANWRQHRIIRRKKCHIRQTAIWKQILLELFQHSSHLNFRIFFFSFELWMWCWRGYFGMFLKSEENEIIKFNKEEVAKKVNIK